MPRQSIGLTKITRPSVGYAHPRERLFKRLDSRRCPLLWVSGPGGAGKTTLAAGYTAACQLRTLWYEVDASDADPASFFHYLGLAAKVAAPRQALKLPHLTPEYGLGLPVFTRRFFEQLYMHLKAPAVLVFDNFQELPPGAPIYRWLAEAFAAIPAGIRVMLLSRDDHPAEFARLRASANLDCLGWDELRLTEDEAWAIARDLPEPRVDTFPQEAIREIVNRADGWAAGLVLMLQAGPTRSGAQPDADSREWMTPGGHNSHTYEFFRKLKTHGGEKRFFHGPDVYGLQVAGILGIVLSYLHVSLRKVPEARVCLVGHSRGGLIAIAAARSLRTIARVHFLGLYDAVDRAAGVDGSVIENVDFVFHAVRDSAVRSRRSFGHSGSGCVGVLLYRRRTFRTTHGGVGGDPDGSYAAEGDSRTPIVTTGPRPLPGVAVSTEPLLTVPLAVQRSESRRAGAFVLDGARLCGLDV